MNSFQELSIQKSLLNAIKDLDFVKPTPIQREAYPKILSGNNVVGIAQTGTGKTLAYSLPILQELNYSKSYKPRVLIIVPTRELVVQVVNQIELYTKYITVRIVGVFGGVNIKTQQAFLSEGTDIVVGTPGRMYDLILNRSLQTQDIKKLVIDEVDVMLDLGFRFQLNNIFELLPEKRQNIMFSATMTDDVQFLIQDNFINPQTITVSVSGTPLDNISQTCYAVPNFHTKLNLLNYLLKDKATFQKVVVFVGSKKYADLIFLELEANFWKELGIIHSNKSQNNRLATIESFNDDQTRILIASDIIARGLDLDDISHVINFDTPKFPENYIHRIGRTGRAKKMGNSILLFTKDEEKNKFTIEKLMGKIINSKKLPDEVVISKKLVLEEQPNIVEKNLHKKSKQPNGPSFHEKKDKNKKQYNLSGGQKIKLKKAKKYKNSITKKFKRK